MFTRSVGGWCPIQQLPNIRAKSQPEAHILLKQRRQVSLYLIVSQTYRLWQAPEVNSVYDQQKLKRGTILTTVLWNFAINPLHVSPSIKYALCAPVPALELYNDLRRTLVSVHHADLQSGQHCD